MASTEEDLTPKDQRGKRPYPQKRTLGSFLPAQMANVATAQSVTREDLAKQLEQKQKRPDGGAVRKRPYSELSVEEKFSNIDQRLNSLRKDMNTNSFRMYGVQKLPDKQLTVEEVNSGQQPRKMFVHEVLEEIFVKALGIEEAVAKTMTTSALTDVYRFRESGTARQYCVVFRLNRGDLCGHIFRNLSKLGNFQNPYGQRPLTISRNLSEEENKERQRCLAVKDILKARGYDPKIKKNIFITVNGSEPKHYSVFLENGELEGGGKRRRLDMAETGQQNSSAQQGSSGASSGSQQNVWGQGSQSSAWGQGSDESTTTGTASGRKDHSVIGTEYPALPNADSLTPAQINTVKAMIQESVRAKTS